MTRKQYLKTVHTADNENSFDYESDGNIMKRSVSPALYQNTKIAGFLDSISNIISHLIKHVKNIKKTYMYAVDIDDDNFN